MKTLPRPLKVILALLTGALSLLSLIIIAHLCLNFAGPTAPSRRFLSGPSAPLPSVWETCIESPLNRFVDRFRPPRTVVVEDPHIYESAIDQWAIEDNKVNSSALNFSDVSDYIRATSFGPRTSAKRSPLPEIPAQSDEERRQAFWDSYMPGLTKPIAPPAPSQP